MSDQSYSSVDTNRRRFLGGAAVAAIVAPGVLLHQLQAKSDDEAASAETRWGMLVDSARCSQGCDVCVKACNETHGLKGEGRPATDAQWIRQVEVRNPATGHQFSLPIMCQHCATPPCADVCPTGASFRRADGIVLVDRHNCIGCRYCMMACPYKARSFVHEDLTDQRPHTPRGKGTVEACNMCVHLVDEGKQPACVDACGHSGGSAMVFGDLNNPDSEISRRLTRFGGSEIRAELGLNTGVRYQGIK